MLTKYNLKMPHAVFSGEDALEKICDIFAENHVKRLAVFSDKGIEGAGLLDFPMARVKASGVAYTVLDDLPAEPSTWKPRSWWTSARNTVLTLSWLSAAAACRILPSWLPS